MLVYGADPAFFEHDTGPRHPERPGRLDAARTGLDALALDADVEWLAARPVARHELERVHTPAYLDALSSFFDQGGGHLDADTVAAPGSARAASLAAGLGVAAIDHLREHPGSGPAFLAVRPPGHHAVPDRAMGFCLYNNVAVAAAAVAAEGERVVVIDWDAHHGNGTQDVFYARDDVFYVSLHQWPLYPGSGRLDECGEARGEGSTLNLPLPPGATGDVYLRAFDEVVLPALEAFDPDWVLVSAGYDAHRDDPLTQLGLTSGDFADMAGRALELAPSPARLVAFLEGGYDLAAVASGVEATLGTWVHGEAHRPESPSSGGPGGDIVDAARALRAS